TWFNKPWLEFTGRSMDLGMGNGWIECVHPEDRERCLQCFAEAIKGPNEFKLEHRLRRRDGEWRWVLCHIVPLGATPDTFVGCISSSVDISERKAVEGILRRSHEELDQRVRERTARLLQANERLNEAFQRVHDLYHYAPCGYHSVDASGRFVEINATALQWL